MNVSVWDTYPENYRAEIVQPILRAIGAGECFAVVGLSGSGKSNLMGFLAHRVRQGPEFVLVDCNRLRNGQPDDLLNLLHQTLGEQPAAGDLLFSLEDILQRKMVSLPQGLCLLFDRFDNLPQEALSAIAGNLRSLRDSFKYQLTYGVASRRPIPEDTELNELFYANTYWLGPLSTENARWSAQQYAQRRGMDWDEVLLEQIIDLSWGYPSLLRAVCEAAVGETPLDLQMLRFHPAVQSRTREFWKDAPDPEAVRLSGLEDQPLLQSEAPPELPDLSKLTASEHRLYQYFSSHPEQVCTHDELIQAVWEEEKLIEGLRDDSLAQLVRRLRAKVEVDPSKPRLILTVPGRGYRFVCQET